MVTHLIPSVNSREAADSYVRALEEEAVYRYRPHHRNPFSGERTGMGKARQRLRNETTLEVWYDLELGFRYWLQPGVSPLTREKAVALVLVEIMPAAVLA